MHWRELRSPVRSSQGRGRPNECRGGKRTRPPRSHGWDALRVANRRCRPAARPQRRDLPRAVKCLEDRYPAAARSSRHLITLILPAVVLSTPIGSKNISKRGPLNRRSLGFARDDKGEGG